MVETTAEASTRSRIVRIRVAIVGSALLCALALARLPWSAEALRPSATPFDRSQARFMAPGYILLVDAARLIPAEASVVVRCRPEQPLLQALFWQFSVALLPNRRILADRHWRDEDAPAMSRNAQYLVLWGPAPASPPGQLLLNEQQGSVWRLVAAP
jgi:hypothetical protein